MPVVKQQNKSIWKNLKAFILLFNKPNEDKIVVYLFFVLFTGPLVVTETVVIFQNN